MKESRGDYSIRQNRPWEKTVTRDKEGHYVVIKGSIHPKDKTVICVCGCVSANMRVPNYIKQMLTDLKGEMGNNTTIVGNLNVEFSTIDRSYRQKINKKETLGLHYTLD